MKAYKLTLAFDNLNQIVDFYINGLCKSQQKTMETIASMGSKGQITINPDKTLTVTWYFRTMPKFNKIADAYVKYKRIPSSYIPTTQKLDYSEE